VDLVDSGEFDYFARVVLSSFHDLDAAAAEWHELSSEACDAFVADWPVNAAHREALREYTETHNLTPEQSCIWSELNAAWRQHVDLMKRLGIVVAETAGRRMQAA
jgi:hypothetical protein